MPELGAARRYASALFAVAVRGKELEGAEKDLATVVQVWDANPQIAAAMARPQVPMEAKRRVWQRLLEGNVGALMQRFIAMLVDKRRIDLLPEVGSEFQRLSDQYRRVMRARVTTAVPLSPDQAEALKARLAGDTGQTVVLLPEVDPSIVGGAIVRIGDRILDGSVRGQLESLRRRLAGVS